MTAANMKKASFTLSPVPETTRDHLGKEALAHAKGVCRTEINRRLQNDRTAIFAARREAKTFHDWAALQPQKRDEIQQAAALRKIEERKRKYHHVSHYFPIFKDYVPPVAYGKVSSEDSEKEDLINKQLESLEHVRARVPHHEEEEGDDEEMMPPSVKKQEDDNTQELREIPRFGRKREARSTPLSLNDQGCSQKTSQWNNSSITTRSTVRDSSSTKSENEDEPESESKSECESESEVEADSEDAGEVGEDEEDYVPMVAVSRTLPLLKDMPASTKDTPAVKHRFSTVCTERGVSRGWVASTDDGGSDIEWVWVEKKGFTPKKRARDADVEDRDQTSKKAKVNVEV